ncbi:hypothetical protein CC78DRAFT_531917 [Lojkania enalia]|uniref:Uncharacterized protein n=1 Tax=Lojkania enalia TaxID=147567 RepID=A0A9P4KDV6_9PLEO|nr:hypothetical protein CC78DRAFT_531917 [Didymosphaeria enalia]
MGNMITVQLSSTANANEELHLVALPRICHQIYIETALMLYPLNTFSFPLVYLPITHTPPIDPLTGHSATIRHPGPQDGQFVRDIVPAPEIHSHIPEPKDYDCGWVNQ